MLKGKRAEQRNQEKTGEARIEKKKKRKPGKEEKEKEPMSRGENQLPELRMLMSLLEIGAPT